MLKKHGERLLIPCTKLLNIKALALVPGHGERDGATGTGEQGTAMLIKKFIVSDTSSLSFLLIIILDDEYK